MKEQNALVERETARAKALSKDGVQIKVSENGAFEVTRSLMAPAHAPAAEREPAAVEPPDGGEWSPEENAMIAGFQNEMQHLRAPIREER